LLGDQTTLDKIDGAVAQPVIIAVGDASCAERAFLRIMARVVSRRGRSFASVAMMAGAAAARFGFGWTAPPVHLARGHAVLLVALGCAGAGALTGARRLRAVRT